MVYTDDRLEGKPPGEIAPAERNVIPLRSINELTQITINKWNANEALIEKTQRKVNLARIEVGFLLLELKQRIDAGEYGELAVWWEFYEEKFKRSRRDAERLMVIAAADDPKAAYELEKAATRERMQATRAKQALAHISACAPSTARAEPPRKSKLPSYIPPASVADAAVQDAAADTEIGQLIDGFLRLPMRQRARFVVRLKQVYRQFTRRWRG